MFIYPCHVKVSVFIVICIVYYFNVINNVYAAYALQTQKIHKNYTLPLTLSNPIYTQRHYIIYTYKKHIHYSYIPLNHYKISYIPISTSHSILLVKITNISDSMKTKYYPLKIHTVTILNKYG